MFLFLKYQILTIRNCICAKLVTKEVILHSFTEGSDVCAPKPKIQMLDLVLHKFESQTQANKPETSAQNELVSTNSTSLQYIC